MRLLLVSVLALPLIGAGCQGGSQPFDCTSTHLQAEPATATGLATLKLRARFTSSNKPVPGTLLDFILVDKKGTNLGTMHPEPTDADGWADAVVEPIYLKVHNPEVDARLLSATGYVVQYHGAGFVVGHSGVPLCGAEAKGSVTFHP